MISWSLFVGDGETDTSLDRFVDFLLASPFAEIQVPLDTRNEFELTKQLWTSPHSSPPVLTPHHQTSSRGVARAPRAGLAGKRRIGGRKRKRRGESRGHGWPRRASGDGARATPKPRLGQGSGKPRGPRACGWHVGGAGKSFVVSRRTSSLLKRSPIPASPVRWNRGALGDPTLTR